MALPLIAIFVFVDQLLQLVFRHKKASSQFGSAHPLKCAIHLECIFLIMTHGKLGELLLNILVSLVYIYDFSNLFYDWEWTNASLGQCSFFTKSHYSFHWGDLEKQVIAFLKF